MGIKIRQITPNIKNWHSTGHVKTTMLTSVGGSIDIDKQYLNEIIEDYMKPVSNKTPLLMGSIERLGEIQCIIMELYDKEPNTTNKCILKILVDLVDVMAFTRNVYFDRIATDNLLKSIQDKYNLKNEEVQNLLIKINNLEGIINPKSAFKLDGTTSAKLVQFKSLLHIKALFSPESAWYTYLHKTNEVEPKLYAQTLSYLRDTYSSKEEAHRALVEILHKEEL